MRLVLIALLLLCGGARAQNEDPDTEVARRHFQEGRNFYDKADYERALAEFTAARRVRPHPALDFNIARCLDRLERWEEAIAAYRSYVASQPPDAEEMRTRIGQLEERLKKEPPKPKPPQERVTLFAPPPSLNESPPPKSNKKTVAIVLGVIGGAVVVGAAVAIGLLVKTTVESPWPDSTGGPRAGTQ
jgi:iron complex outermembrane receptor protein